MRIDLFNSAATELAGELNTQSASTGKPPAVSQNSTVDATEDRTTLASGSTAVDSLVSQAMNSPEVRQDLVQTLQQAIQSGQYKLEPDQIAGAMIDEQA
jgi:flagellar biosynthesis anti-sigma factor FlgM